MSVVPLPVRPDVSPSQPELFPYARPETVLAYLRNAEHRVLDVGPELTERDALDLLGELALLNLRLDRIGSRIHLSPAYGARQALPVVIPFARPGVLRA